MSDNSNVNRIIVIGILAILSYRYVERKLEGDYAKRRSD